MLAERPPRVEAMNGAKCANLQSKRVFSDGLDSTLPATADQGEERPSSALCIASGNLPPARPPHRLAQGLKHLGGALSRGHGVGQQDQRTTAGSQRLRLPGPSRLIAGRHHPTQEQGPAHRRGAPEHETSPTHPPGGLHMRGSGVGPDSTLGIENRELVGGVAGSSGHQRAHQRRLARPRPAREDQRPPPHRHHSGMHEDAVHCPTGDEELQIRFPGVQNFTGQRAAAPTPAIDPEHRLPVGVSGQRVPSMRSGRRGAARPRRESPAKRRPE
jgi:hypothetical protein